MKKSDFQGEAEKGIHVAGSLSSSTTHVRSDHEVPPKAPRWVKVLVIGVIVLLILRFIVIPYLSGYMGFDGRIPFVSVITYGGQLLWL